MVRGHAALHGATARLLGEARLEMALATVEEDGERVGIAFPGHRWRPTQHLLNKIRAEARTREREWLGLAG